MGVFKHIAVTWLLAVSAGTVLLCVTEYLNRGNTGRGAIDALPFFLIFGIVFGFPSFLISWLLLFILMKVPLPVQFKMVSWIILCLCTLIFNFLLLTDFKLFGRDWELVEFVVQPFFMGTLLILLIRIPFFILLALKFSNKSSNN